MTIPLITGQLNPSQGDFNNLINQINTIITSISPLTGDVTSVGHVTTVAKIQGTTVSGTTGTGNVVFSNNATLIASALGTPTALVGTNITGTAANFTAGTVTGLVIATGKTLTSNNNITLTGTDGVSMNVTNSKVRTIGFSVSSASLTTGQQGGYVVVPVSGTITGWSICANAGTATVTTWKIANGTAVPTVSNSISTAGVALSTGTAIESTTVSDFTSVVVTAGDIFAFNLSAVSGVTTLQFQLQITVA